MALVFEDSDRPWNEWDCVGKFTGFPGKLRAVNCAVFVNSPPNFTLTRRVHGPSVRLYGSKDGVFLTRVRLDDSEVVANSGRVRLGGSLHCVFLISVRLDGSTVVANSG
jgi:hypothetical protein